MKVDVSGLKTSYFPGDNISIVAFLETKENCNIVSSNFNIFRSDGIKYNTLPVGNISRTTWEISKHYNEEVISSEKNGVDLRGVHMIRGKLGRTGYKLSFSLPETISNSSMVTQCGNVHYNKYFIRFEFKRSYIDNGKIIINKPISTVLEVNVENKTPIDISPTRCMLAWSGTLGPLVKSVPTMACVLKCDSTTFLPGETFDSRVAISNTTGKRIRKVTIHYANTVSVLESSSVNNCRLITKSGYSIRSISGGGDRKNTRILLEGSISRGECMKFTVHIPEHFMDRSLVNAKIINKYIVVKCHFYTGLPRTFKFIVG